MGDPPVRDPDRMLERRFDPLSTMPFVRFMHVRSDSIPGDIAQNMAISRRKWAKSLLWHACLRATVYAVSAGKQGLLRTLMDIWTTAPVVETTLRRVDALDDPEAIVRLVAATCCGMRKEYGDIMRVILNTAPHDPEVAETLATATERYRQALVHIGRRLAELGALREGMDQSQGFVAKQVAPCCVTIKLRDRNGRAPRYDRGWRHVCMFLSLTNSSSPGKRDSKRPVAR